MGWEGGALSNCALTGSEGLVRPEAVRAAGGTGSDIKVTEERLAIKMRRDPNDSRDARISDSLVRDLSPRCTVTGQANSSDDC